MGGDGTGRVFVSKNANAAAGIRDRIADRPADDDPGRFVSGIYIDPTNANHAWITYSGFNANTPAQPGHVFSVVFNPGTGTATFTSLDGTGTTAYPDIPATDVVATTRTAISTCRTTSASCCCRVARRTGRSPVTACLASRSQA